MLCYADKNCAYLSNKENLQFSVTIFLCGEGNVELLFLSLYSTSPLPPSPSYMQGQGGEHPPPSRTFSYTRKDMKCPPSMTSILKKVCVHSHVGSMRRHAFWTVLPAEFFLLSVRVHFDSDLPELFINFRIFSGNLCGIAALKNWRIFSDIKRIQYRTRKTGNG